MPCRRGACGVVALVAALLLLCVWGDHAIIREWVLHHHLLGVNKFYVFDDGSRPPLKNTLQDLIDSGLVEYTHLTRPLPTANLQLAMASLAYRQVCLERARRRHTFLGFIDTDEFIVPKNKKETVNTLLRDFDKYGGLALNWRIFGSSGYINRPLQGMLRSYTACLPHMHWLHTHVKSIVRVESMAASVSSHHFSYTQGYYAVTTNGEKVESDFSRQPIHDRVALHHYVTGSVEDFQAKSERGLDDGKPGRTADFFEEMNSLANSTCSQGLYFGEQLAAVYGHLL